MSSSALIRQNRRLERLKSEGVSRTTVLVHENCKPALDDLRSHLVDPAKADALSNLVTQIQAIKSPTNVAQVKHLSPFRYPGGKTWLVPEVRRWLKLAKTKPSIFVEPFAGGAMASLTVAIEDLAQKVAMTELDDDVAAVWHTLISGPDADVKWLNNKILNFEVNLDNVRKILDGNAKSFKTKAFKTIIKNRMQRGGIMAAGAGLVKSGEDGKGLFSRWYPATLVKRIELIRTFNEKIQFDQGDAFDTISKYKNDPSAYFFVDPPYTAGGKNAGSRLYTHSIIDHEKLFKTMSEVKGSVMLTYDDAPEVRHLAAKYGFRIEQVPMKNTHHQIMKELLILKP